MSPKIPKAAFSVTLLAILAVLTFRQSGAYRDMETLWRRTLSANPKSAMAHNNLGMLLTQQGGIHEAMYYLQRAVTLDPGNAEAHNNYGNALRLQGRPADAVTEFRRAAELRPSFGIYHANLGSVLAQTGQTEEAIVHYEKAIQSSPSDPFIANNLAWLLATAPGDSVHNPQRAIELAEQAAKLVADNPVILTTLAVAYGTAGRFDEAIVAAEKAHQIAESQNNPTLTDLSAKLLDSFRAGRPYR
jgi:tetratricopeptide (TPR) repeat protein